MLLLLRLEKGGLEPPSLGRAWEERRRLGKEDTSPSPPRPVMSPRGRLTPTGYGTGAVSSLDLL